MSWCRTYLICAAKRKGVRISAVEVVLLIISSCLHLSRYHRTAAVLTIGNNSVERGYTSRAHQENVSPTELYPIYHYCLFFRGWRVILR